MDINLIILIMLAVLILIGLILLIRAFSGAKQKSDAALLREIDTRIHQTEMNILREQTTQKSDDQKAIREGLISIQESTEKRLRSNQQMIYDTINEGMNKLLQLSDRRLNIIQAQINDKLDVSLNERLDENFRQIGERLEQLYKSLGELKNLESGVFSLNRTLSNVKSRGVFGELQLENILADILDKSQYEANVATGKNSTEFVEFAVKIPDKNNAGNFIYLPIDSKFPADIYNHIIDASANADAAALSSAQKELQKRIQMEALSIRDKYVHPPKTTDFAVMFLPTESLYAEVLRIDGLAEDCQKRFHVVIAGPMTLCALLNSLSIGFKYLTVNKKTEEIMKTLVSFKTQFEKFDELIDQMQKSLTTAAGKTDKLKDRSRLIRQRLSKVEKYEIDETTEPLLLADEAEEDPE